jgi:DNA-binding XRE family transcriptional regulator
MTTHPLIAARKAAGLSQQALADLIDKDRLTILRIENAQTQPPLETVSKIITALREKNVELSADAFLRAAEPSKASAA